MSVLERLGHRSDPGDILRRGGLLLVGGSVSQVWCIISFLVLVLMIFWLANCLIASLWLAGIADMRDAAVERTTVMVNSGDGADGEQSRFCR